MSTLLESVKFALSKIKKGSVVLIEQQLASIDSVVLRKDTVVCLPTGHGKSIIFEVVPWCQQFSDVHLVLIVSPLVSLMDKQVSNLVERGLKAARLSSDLPAPETDAVQRAVFTYIFSSPELLQEGKWRRSLLNAPYQRRLTAVFINEAHCMEMWGGGKDPFRLSYGALGDLRSFVPTSVHFCALTATASNKTRQFIVNSLGLVNAVTICLSPNRNNLFYTVVKGSGEVREDDRGTEKFRLTDAKEDRVLPID